MCKYDDGKQTCMAIFRGARANSKSAMTDKGKDCKIPVQKVCTGI